MKRRLPLIVYLVVYVLTCLLGALLLLFSDGFQRFAQLFTGIRPFRLSSEQVFLDLILLLLAPILVVAGYEIALRVHRRYSTTAAIPEKEKRVALLLVWAAATTLAIVSLIRGGAFRNIAAWTDYRAWVLARWELFDKLTFLEFVNIYNLLPLASGLLILQAAGAPVSRARQVLTAAGAALPVLLADLLLFQKKTFLVFLILVALAFLVYRDLFSAAFRSFRFLALTGTAIYLLYCVLVAGPAASRNAHAMAGQPTHIQEQKVPAEAERILAALPASSEGEAKPSEEGSSREFGLGTPPSPGPVEGEPSVGPTGRPIGPSYRHNFVRSVTRSLFPARWIGMNGEGVTKLPQLSRGPALFLYVFFGPFVRTSIPALAYPVVYPARIPFYGLDSGLDLVGIGQMPRDNIFVHHLLWPAISGGTIMVPFQFALFSQVGLGGALLLSALIGYLLAIVWIWLLGSSTDPKIRALACSLALIFVLQAAGDSLRNSLLASYGVLWGAIFLFGWSLFLRLRSRRNFWKHARLSR